MIHIASGTPDTRRPTVLFDNLFTKGVFEASNTLAGTYAENLLGPQTYDGWTANSAGGASLTVTLPASAACDCAVLMGHNCATVGAFVQVMRWNGSSFAAVSGATVAPTDNSPLMILFPEASSDQWRLRFYNSTDRVTARIAMMGKRLVFPSSLRPDYVPAPAARRVDTITNRTLGGHYAGGVVYRRALEMNASFNPLPRSFVDSDMAAFREHYDAGGTFFWAGSPSSMPNDLAYCWRPEGSTELRPAYVAGTKWANVSMGLDGYGA